jgi:ribosome-binding factor A
MAHRIEKIESLLKEELSKIILFKLNDPLFGFLTVTSVKVSPDLRIAKVYISIFEKEKRQMTLDRLTNVAHTVRSELASRLTMRYVPELKFFLDDTLDYVEKIDALIKKIHEDDNKE